MENVTLVTIKQDSTAASDALLRQTESIVDTQRFACPAGSLGHITNARMHF